jgi:hypothetical protein
VKGETGEILIAFVGVDGTKDSTSPLSERARQEYIQAPSGGLWI